MSAELFDENEFMEEFEDSIDIMETMLPKFEKGLNDSLGKCDQLLASKDAHALAEELHSLKGMVGTLYSPLLYELAVKMEHAAKENTLDGVSGHLQEFRDKLPRGVSIVSDIIQREAS